MKENSVWWLNRKKISLVGVQEPKAWGQGQQSRQRSKDRGLQGKAKVCIFILRTMESNLREFQTEVWHNQILPLLWSIFLIYYLLGNYQDSKYMTTKLCLSVSFFLKISSQRVVFLLCFSNHLPYILFFFLIKFATGSCYFIGIFQEIYSSQGLRAEGMLVKRMQSFSYARGINSRNLMYTVVATVSNTIPCTWNLLRG